MQAVRPYWRTSIVDLLVPENGKIPKSKNAAGVSLEMFSQQSQASGLVTQSWPTARSNDAASHRR
jgi:hypothetical protein